MTSTEDYIVYIMLFALGGLFGLYVHHLSKEWLRMKAEQKNLRDKWKNR